ncbi:19751_t:CDS:1, partial [Gigaspora margarita]
EATTDTVLAKEKTKMNKLLDKSRQTPGEVIQKKDNQSSPTIISDPRMKT